MTHSVCNQEKTNETEEEALQNKGVDVRAPQDASNPQSAAIWATFEVS